MIDPFSIGQMYPRVLVATLLTDECQQRFQKYFLDSGEFDADPFEVIERTERPQKKCFSASLFKQNPDNRKPNEYRLNEIIWRSKYWTSLLKLTEELRSFPEWKLRIHVERDLWGETYAALGAHSQVELYRMAVNSVGAGPGALWRFMAFSDLSQEIVLETDIDEPLSGKIDYIRSFEMSSHPSVGRIGGFVSDRKYLVDPRRSSVRNYACMTASCVISRPMRFDFDVTVVMRGFMAYRRHYSTTARFWAYSEDELLSDYNRPIGNHLYGWGSHWYVYGFDERFLKHVIYYHFAEQGTLLTWTTSIPPWQMDVEGLVDLQYIRSHGNPIVCPHTIIQLDSLQLSPATLRIAWSLDEYRWIFDSLSTLMQKHGCGDFSGSIFFDQVAGPYCVELVPKQLSLFQCARAASKALEIGFNAGHSTALMLLANPDLRVRAFDRCSQAYTKPCFDFLNSIFRGRITLVEGSSRVTVPLDSVSGYDLLHVDANHEKTAAPIDLADGLSKCTRNAIVILDDDDRPESLAYVARLREDLMPTEAFTSAKAFRRRGYVIFHYSPTHEKSDSSDRIPSKIATARPKT